MSNTFERGTRGRIIELACAVLVQFNHVIPPIFLLDANLHSPERRLIELRMEHGDLDALIDRASEATPVDELMMRRLKKRRLALRDEISRMEQRLSPDEPA